MKKLATIKTGFSAYVWLVISDYDISHYYYYCFVLYLVECYVYTIVNIIRKPFISGSVKPRSQTDYQTKVNYDFES